MSWRASGAAAMLLVAACSKPADQPGTVTANGVTLAAQSIELPMDDVALPAGLHRELVEQNCTACHSPAMITAQPALTRAQWQATVEKMAKVYKAPVDAAAVPGILDYLAGLTDDVSPQRLPGEGRGSASAHRDERTAPLR